MPSKAVRTAEAKRKTRIYLAIGALTLLILLVTLATAGRQKTLRCDRQAAEEVDCVVKQSILGAITLNEKTIPGAQAISIGQQCPDVECTYRLQIYGAQGLVPVDEKYTSDYERQLRIKEEINNFFTDKSSPYVLMEEKTNPYLLAAVVAVFLLIWAYLGYLIWQAYHQDSPEHTG
ncbi:MAG: hypothetical protein A2Y88_13735 [Chloroflexi bacterium RBG_13_48_10]|nr:MAG: hypothetical protein A2Y88_13735 [Chloroflexi bacterium RBG_13_48_10]